MNGPSAQGNERRARWSLRLFGTFELSTLPEGERITSLGKRERALLAALVLSPSCRQPRRKLTTLLWGEAADETTFNNLRTSVWRLRKALGDSGHRIIASEGEDVVLDASAFDADVLTFRRIAARPERSALEAAAALYRGELLDGLDIDSGDFESWRRSEAARCWDQAIDVLARLMAQLADAGEAESAIETGERILRLEPLHEATVRHLMRLYSNNGRRGAAIQLYRTLGDTLRNELDASPESETRAVLAEVARGRERPPPSRVSADAEPAPSSPGSVSWPTKADHTDDEGFSGRVDRRVFRRSTRRKRNWILAGGFVAALLAVLLLYQFVSTTDAPSSPADAISIAVLPFANLSSDPEQEFFSDGMTDEIISALANIRGLRVVARSSAFQFKGENRDLRAIGQSLGATHLLEGSVRKARDQVRIAAQLVQADNGMHVWAETYERNFTDIFAIQEQVAQAIAASLRVPLGLREGDGLVRNRTTDLDAYQLYLRAGAHMRAYRSRPGDPVVMLEQAVARDPGYAPAWALLAVAHTLSLFNVSSSFEIPIQESRRIVSTVLSQAERTARRAIELDSDLADGYASLAFIQDRRGWHLSAEELYLKALAVDRDNPEALHNYSSLLASVGRLKEAVAMKERLLALEPFVPVYNQIAAWVLWSSGQSDAAITIFQAMNPVDRGPLLAGVYASLGRYGEAVAELTSRNPNSGTASVLSMAPAKAASPQTLPHLDLTSFAYLYVGASDRFLEGIERQVETGYVDSHRNVEVWHPSPSYAAVRKTERFKAFARNAGLVDYWRVKGWPEFCHPVGADDFACD